MRTLKTLAVAATATLAMSSAFAAQGKWVDGETGFVPAPAKSERTRAAVQQELRDFKRHAVSHDGVAFVGGEQGYKQVPVAGKHPGHGGASHVTDAGKRAAPAAGATQAQ